MSKLKMASERHELPEGVTLKLRELYKVLRGPQEQFNLYVGAVYSMAGLDQAKWDLAEDGSALVRKEG